MWGPAWIEIHWNSIWLRDRSHMTSLHDFEGVLGQPLDTFFWAPTISWSWLLARVWSGLELAKWVSDVQSISVCDWRNSSTTSPRKIWSWSLCEHCQLHVPMWDQREDGLIYGHRHMLIVLLTSKRTWVLFGSFFSCSPPSTDYIYTTKPRVAPTNRQWNMCKNRIGYGTYPYFHYGYRKCMFVDFFISCACLSNCVHYWVLE
jgi:hypothetical protein